MRKYLTALLPFVLVACATVASATELEKLGTFENPVNSHGPKGQREYLSKLICADGKPPVKFFRNGSVGFSKHSGHMIDSYLVICITASGEKTFVVYMDLYHAGYKETRAIEGFTLIEN